MDTLKNYAAYAQKLIGTKYEQDVRDFLLIGQFVSLLRNNELLFTEPMYGSEKGIQIPALSFEDLPTVPRVSEKHKKILDEVPEFTGKGGGPASELHNKAMHYWMNTLSMVGNRPVQSSDFQQNLETARNMEISAAAAAKKYKTYTAKNGFKISYDPKEMPLTPELREKFEKDAIKLKKADPRETMLDAVWVRGWEYVTNDKGDPIGKKWVESIEYY